MRSFPQCRFLRSSNFSLKLCVYCNIFGYIQSFIKIKIRSVTAEILLTLSFCGWVGGWVGWVGWGGVCTVIILSNPTFVEVRLGFWQQVTTVLDGHPPSKLWSLTFPRRVTKFKKDGHQLSPGWSPTITRMVNHHPQMVTYHSKAWSPTIPRMFVHQQ